MAILFVLFSYAVVFVVSMPSHSLSTMPLKCFHWNGLYAVHLDKWAFAKKWILDHFNWFVLVERGVGRTSVRYVTFECCSFNWQSTFYSHRPTDWHRESGVAHSGGHITVDFRSPNNRHVVIHHVYPTDNAYSKWHNEQEGSLVCIEIR